MVLLNHADMKQTIKSSSLGGCVCVVDGGSWSDGVELLRQFSSNCSMLPKQVMNPCQVLTHLMPDKSYPGIL